MTKRAEWAKILDVEAGRWSEKSCEQLIEELRENRTYQVEVESKRYQIEVDLLENTSSYLHVGVSVDDGSLPWSIFPVSSSFIKQKAHVSQPLPPPLTRN